MKNMKRSDVVWSVILTAVPLLALLVGIIPGSIQIYDTQNQQMNYYCLLSPIPGNAMGSTTPLLLIVPLYAAILGFCYLKSQKINTLKAVLIVSILAAVIAWMPVLLESHMLFWPYGAVPIILTVQCVLAFIRFKIEDANYEY